MNFTTRFTHFTSAVLILGLMAGLCGCDQFITLLSTDTEEHIIDTPIDFDIGLSLPLTGTTTASTGLSMQRGFNLARDEINELGSPVRINFIIEDDGGTAEGAVTAVRTTRQRRRHRYPRHRLLEPSETSVSHRGSERSHRYQPRVGCRRTEQYWRVHLSHGFSGGCKEYRRRQSDSCTARL